MVANSGRVVAKNPTARPRTLGFESVSRSLTGITVTRADFGPYRPIPPHEHSELAIILFLRGDLSGQWPCGAVCRTPLSASIDPNDEINDVTVGPRGMSIVLVEFDDMTAAEIGLSRKSLGGPSILGGPAIEAVCLGMALTGGSASDFALEQQAIEVGSLFRNSEPPTQRPAWLDNARQYVETMFREPIGLRLVAKEVGIDATHLARRFRAEYGRSVGDFLGEVRLCNASKMILQGASLEQAALETGFTDTSHLRRRFRQRFHSRPTAIREF